VPKQTLLQCNVCKSPDIEVKGKYGAMLHTICNGCGLNNWDQVQTYLRRLGRRPQRSNVEPQRVEVHRKGKVEIHTVLKRS